MADSLRFDILVISPRRFITAGVSIPEPGGGGVIEGRPPVVLIAVSAAECLAKYSPSSLSWVNNDT